MMGAAGLEGHEGTHEVRKADLGRVPRGFTAGGKPLCAELRVGRVYNGYSTRNEKVFVAGDARRGPSLVIWGIREGRKTAEKIDQNLRMMVTE
jgi:glutamate synthase (NADPH/NADH) small chain